MKKNKIIHEMIKKNFDREVIEYVFPCYGSSFEQCNKVHSCEWIFYLNDFIQELNTLEKKQYEWGACLDLVGDRGKQPECIVTANNDENDKIVIEVKELKNLSTCERRNEISLEKFFTNLQALIEYDDELIKIFQKKLYFLNVHNEIPWGKTNFEMNKNIKEVKVNIKRILNSCFSNAVGDEQVEEFYVGKNRKRKAGNTGRVKFTFGRVSTKEAERCGLHMWGKPSFTSLNALIPNKDQLENVIVDKFFKEAVLKFDRYSDCKKILLIINDISHCNDIVKERIAKYRLPNEIDELWIGMHIYDFVDEFSFEAYKGISYKKLSVSKSE